VSADAISRPEASVATSVSKEGGKPIRAVPWILICPRNSNIHPYSLSWSITQAVTYTHIPSLETMMYTWNIDYVHKNIQQTRDTLSVLPYVLTRCGWIGTDLNVWHNPEKILSRQDQQKTCHHERLNERGSQATVSWKKKQKNTKAKDLSSLTEEIKGEKKKEGRKKGVIKWEKIRS